MIKTISVHELHEIIESKNMYIFTVHHESGGVIYRVFLKYKDIALRNVTDQFIVSMDSLPIFLYHPQTELIDDLYSSILKDFWGNILSISTETKLRNCYFNYGSPGDYFLKLSFADLDSKNTFTSYFNKRKADNLRYKFKQNKIPPPNPQWMFIYDPFLFNLESAFLGFNSLSPLFEGISDSHFKILSFDIECLPGDDQTLSRSELNPIVCISYHISDNRGENGCLAWSHHYKTLVDQGSIILKKKNIELYASELDMIKAFIRVVNYQDPDIITGYNIVKFDLPYLLKRYEILEMANETFYQRISRYSAKSVNVGVSDLDVDYEDNEEDDDYEEFEFDNFKEYEVKNYSSRVRNSDKEEPFPEIMGRIVADLCNLIIRTPSYDSFSSYSLESVCDNLLGPNLSKYSLPFTLIKKKWESEKLASAMELWYYCNRDAKLCTLLNSKTGLIGIYMDLAFITHCPPQISFQHRQQVRVISLLFSIALEKKVLLLFVPYKERHELKNGIRGGYVFNKDDRPSDLKSKSSFIAREMVQVLDYSSLYPSVMIANQTCFSTFRQLMFNYGEVVVDSENLEGSRKLELDLREMKNIHDSSKFREEMQRFFMPRDEDETIVPYTLRRLGRLRQELKRKIEDMKGDNESKIIREGLDRKQTAVKLAMNSMFGCFSLKKGILQLPVLGQKVTEGGRVVITKTYWLLTDEKTGFLRENVMESICANIKADFDIRDLKIGVVYGDTDSLFLEFRGFGQVDKLASMDATKREVIMRDVAKRIADYLVGYINMFWRKWYKLPEDNPSTISIVNERTLYRFHFMGNKEYFGLLANGKMYIKGGTIRKRGTPSIISSSHQKFSLRRNISSQSQPCNLGILISSISGISSSNSNSLAFLRGDHLHLGP